MDFDPLARMIELFDSLNFTAFWSDFLSHLVLLVTVLLLSWFAWWLTIKVVYRILRKLVRKTKATWDDELLERKLFDRLAWIAPASMMRALSRYGDGTWELAGFLLKLADLAILFGVTLAMVDFLGFLNDLYNRRQDSKRRPIKGIIQAVQVLILAIGIIIAFSSLSGQPISGLMAGLGAVSAVLMLVFQDPLKGLAAGFQISSNDMVRIGDWIEMPSHGADGDVIDISLLNVTVRNWDKTYVTFPIQALTNGAFKNWRGMSESGGRRIKRSVNIDMSSIKFLDDEEIKRLTSISILKEFIAQRQEEIRQWNQEQAQDRQASPVNGRALTNIGIFRAYTKAYLSTHPKTNPRMTLLVRQLQSGPQGLPMEIYVFSSDKVWANYEDFQSDIFDHLLAVLPEFGLRAFQDPSGLDIKSLSIRA